MKKCFAPTLSRLLSRARVLQVDAEAEAEAEDVTDADVVRRSLLRSLVWGPFGLISFFKYVIICLKHI